MCTDKLYYDISIYEQLTNEVKRYMCDSLFWQWRLKKHIKLVRDKLFFVIKLKSIL